MNLLDKIFKKEPKPMTKTKLELTGNDVIFTSWNGNAYDNDIFRGGVDAIARNCGKLKISHVIYGSDGKKMGDDYLNGLLQVQPNKYMTAYDMIYKMTTHLYLYNNAFTYVQRDDKGKVIALLPIRVLNAEFLTDENGQIYCKFIFINGKEYTLPYDDIIHIKRFLNNNDMLGENNEALAPALELAHTQNEGIVNGIKTGVTLRGILKFTQVLSPDVLKQQKDDFMADYMALENNGGIVALDQKAEYTPIEQKALLIDGSQLKATKEKIYSYLGITENIVNSNYNENEWASFYESTIEPIALQLGLEFTRKIFNAKERKYGNSIIVESGRLQFTSNESKINLLKELMPMGLFTVNQALEILNLPLLNGEDGERRIQSLNYVDQKIVNDYQLKNASKNNIDNKVKEKEGEK